MIERAIAQTIDTSGFNGITLGDFPGKLKGAYEVVMGVVAMAIVLNIVYAGYMFITSGGDVAKVSQAKRSIIMSVIGIIVIVLAYVIVVTIGKGAESL